jgi:transcription elongation factor Elf1
MIGGGGQSEKGMKIGATIFHGSRHLTENQLLERQTACFFCEASARKPIYYLQEEPKVTLLQCAACGAVSASRIPKPEALDDYYSHYYEQSKAFTTEERVTFHDSQRFGRHLARRILRYGRGNAVSVLDFGGGDGCIAIRTAEVLLRAGIEHVDITVVDHNEKLMAVDDPRIVVTRSGTLDTGRQYSMVIASAIIEHLPHPKSVLIQLVNRLALHGIFYARTPSVVPLMKLLKPLGVRIDFTFPGHLHDLGQNFWEALFEKVFSPEDFVILESRPSIVETSFRESFIRTLAAYLLKAPWHLAGRRYGLVGGWEIFVQKINSKVIADGTQA